IDHWRELFGGQTSEWKEFLNEQVDAIAAVLEQERETAESTVEGLRKLYNEARAEAKALDDAAIREQQLLADIERLQAVHTTLVARMADFQLADDAISKGRASVTV